MVGPVDHVCGGKNVPFMHHKAVSSFYLLVATGKQIQGIVVNKHGRVGCKRFRKKRIAAVLRFRLLTGIECKQPESCQKKVEGFEHNKLVLFVLFRQLQRKLISVECWEIFV